MEVGKKGKLNDSILSFTALGFMSLLLVANFLDENNQF